MKIENPNSENPTDSSIECNPDEHKWSLIYTDSDDRDDFSMFPPTETKWCTVCGALGRSGGSFIGSVITVPTQIEDHVYRDSGYVLTAIERNRGERVFYDFHPWSHTEPHWYVTQRPDMIILTLDKARDELCKMMTNRKSMEVIYEDSLWVAHTGHLLKGAYSGAEAAHKVARDKALDKLTPKERRILGVH